MMKSKTFIFKHQYKHSPRRLDCTGSRTIPDLVLSMRDIYLKYAVTGDISSLPGRIRPYSDDDVDSDLEAPDYEEFVDVSYARVNAQSEVQRMRQQDSAHPAAEDISVGSQEPSDKEPQAPAKPETPESDSSDDKS